MRGGAGKNMFSHINGCNSHITFVFHLVSCSHMTFLSVRLQRETSSRGPGTLPLQKIVYSRASQALQNPPPLHGLTLFMGLHILPPPDCQRVVRESEKDM